jgi:hypothetical protein
VRQFLTADPEFSERIPFPDFRRICLEAGLDATRVEYKIDAISRIW